MNEYKKIIESNTFAVIGATQKKEKFGFKVFKALIDENKIVYPINPNYSEILGIKCFSSLKELPEKPNVVVTIVKPEITESIVKECLELGIRNVWMQPGSESQKAIELCKRNNINVIYDACIIVDGFKKKL